MGLSKEVLPRNYYAIEVPGKAVIKIDLCDYTDTVKQGFKMIRLVRSICHLSCFVKVTLSVESQKRK